MNTRSLAAAFFTVLYALPPARAADFAAAQTAYSALQGKNAVLLTWSDDSPEPGSVTIRRDATVIATVPGVTGTNEYTAEDVPLGKPTFSAEGPNGPLGSQVQTVIADHSEIFGNPSNPSCHQEEVNGDCEIVIDWDTGAPPPPAYELSLDGSHYATDEPFPTDEVIHGATPGEHCVKIQSSMVRGPGEENEGRFLGEPVETCCEITCGIPGCLTPTDFAISQVKYGTGPAGRAVLARWKLPAGPYAAGIKTFVNGAETGAIDGSATRHVFEGLSSAPEVGVQGDCGEAAGLSGIARDRMELLAETPHKNPIAGTITCEWNAAARKTTATWTNADPSKLIDVYIVEGGVKSFVTTIPGDQTGVTLSDTAPSDRIELQFFALVDGFCYGSEPVACTPPDGGNRFIAGICSSDGQGGEPNISNAIFGLNYLFIGGNTPACLKACHVNADAKFDLSDMVYLLTYLFNGGPPPVGWGGPDPACGSAPAEECETANAACAG